MPMDHPGQPPDDQALFHSMDALHAAPLDTLARIKDAVFSVDRNWRFTYLNPEAERIAKMPQADLLGRSLWETYPQLLGTEFEAQYRKAMADQRTVRFEGRHPRNNIWFEVHAYPAADGLTVFYHEVTERKSQEAELQQALANERRARQEAEQANARLRQAEQAARESAQKVTRTLESISDGFFLLDRAWHISYVNPQGAQLLLRSCDELLGRNLWDCFPEAVGSTFYREYHRALQEQVTVSFVEFYPPLQSWFEVHAYPMPEGLAVYFQNVTDRKQAEEALLRQNERLCLLSETAAFLLENNDPDHLVEGVFERVAQHLRADVFINFMLTPAGDALCLDFSGGLSKEARRSFARLELGQALCGTVVQTGTPLVVNHMQESDDPRAALLRAQGVRAYCGHPLLVGGRVVGTLSFASRHLDKFSPEDVDFLYTVSQYVAMAHERKRLMAELRDRAARLSVLIAAQREIAHTEPRLDTRLGLLVAKAQEVARATGAAVARVEGEELVYTAASGTLQACVGSRMHRDQSIIGLTVKEARPLRSDDTETDSRVDIASCRRYNVRSLVTVPLIYNRVPVGVLTIASDRPGAFTEEHLTIAEVMGSIVVAAMSAVAVAETQEALSTVEERLRLAVEGAKIGVWSWVAATDTADWSPVMHDLFGLEPGTPMDRERSLATVHTDDRDRLEQAINKALTERTSYEIEHRILRPDGKERWIASRGHGVYAEDGTLLRIDGVMLDITEQKRLQAQLLQAQKMEGIGRLAGGIAHDFNNLLSVILGYAELIQLDINEQSPLWPSVHNIQAAANRAAALTRQLLAFARRQMTEPKVVNLNQLLTDMGAMLRPLVGEHIELRVHPKADPSRVKVDPNQIEQVIVNLAVNARDAMPQGGTLLIQTDNAVLEVGQTQEEIGVTPGSYVRISVSDTGTGMSAEVQNNAFDPFFTTKEVGKGTGLGLATCYGIVRQSGGYIWVYSEEGVGTTFRIYLPLAEDAVTDTTMPVTRPSAARGTATVLVVEDEELVRNLVVGALQSHGYTVLQADNGVAGLKTAAKYAGPIHLLLTDLIMPQMGGEDLAMRLKEQRPDIKVVFMSGYSEDMALLRGLLPMETTLLEKPIPPSVMLPRIEQVLADN